MFFKKNGQISSIDMLISGIIFLMIFISIRSIWIENLNEIQDSLNSYELELKSIQAINCLLKTPGFPIDWNSSNVELIGLAKKPFVLSEDKVNKFLLLDYNSAKRALGIDGYEFNFTIFDDALDENKFFGINPTQKSVVYSVNRKVIFNEVSANAKISIFYEPK